MEKRKKEEESPFAEPLTPSSPDNHPLMLFELSSHVATVRLM